MNLEGANDGDRKDRSSFDWKPGEGTGGAAAGDGRHPGDSGGRPARFPRRAPELLREIFTTSMGLLFLLIGNGVGAVLALAVFSFSVTSFPMLFDRDIDFVTAMIASVKVVKTNPSAMIAWCATIAGGLIGLSLLSGLIGLLVVLPILGHASWHLYRRAIGPAPTARDSRQRRI